MASEEVHHVRKADLFSYFNQPYAILHSDFDDTQLIWAYSFWARRWNDKHIDLCRRFLDRILETYPNKTYTAATMDPSNQHYREQYLNKQS